MINTHSRPWIRGTIPICTATNQHAFESHADAARFFRDTLGPEFEFGRLGPCDCCDGFHIKNTYRSLPANAIMTGRRLSAEDTKKFKT